VGKVEYRILGPLEVVAADDPLPLGGPKQRSLLALLLLHANEVVSTDELIDRLWGARPPATAPKIVQVQVWRLRKALGGDELATRPPGYVLRVREGELDLARFERLVSEARGAEPEAAAAKLREALSLWRGAPLADLAYESFASAEVARLEELRLVALEEQIEADLALGRHAELVPELEALAAEHPLRERLRGQLMLALYRSGRQAEALDAYRRARQLLLEDLGLDPSPPLQELERAILAQDPSLDAPAGETQTRQERAILVAPNGQPLPALLTLAEPLAAEPGRELIVARVVSSDQREELAQATAELNAQRGALESRGVTARVASFTSGDRAADLVRLAADQDVDLLLVAAELGPLQNQVPGGELGALLADAPCDVALLSHRGDELRAGPVLVPFGAAHHDWAALELGALIARTHGAPLQLVGSVSGEMRDASRLLADASLIVQRIAGIAAEPLLAEPGADGLLAAADAARMLVVGLSERWQREGLGKTRLRIAEEAVAPVLLVRRGLRPGGLAPTETRTRFTWSLTRAVS
jgi:DNA-binding SARP family transcriptional activator